MKRFRARAVGLGLALAAGSAGAADGEWRPLGQPPAGELRPAGAANPPAAPQVDPGPLWLPLAAPDRPAVVTAGTAGPAAAAPPNRQPPPQFQPVQWAPDPGFVAGPRTTGSGPLPEIPVAPPTESAAPAPQPEPPLVRRLPTIHLEPGQPPADQPPADPKPANPPAMTPPKPPEFAPGGTGNPLPTPRPVDPPPQPLPQPELAPAPAGAAYPAGWYQGSSGGAPGGSLGAPPIRLAPDYPPLRDLFRQKGDLRDDVGLTDGPGGGALNRYFVSGEYLLWWLPGFPTPALATTNANTALNGYLGEPGTTALIGPGALLSSTRSGVRVRAGAWFDDCGTCGIDAGFFVLPTRSTTVATNPDLDPITTRPIFAPNVNPTTGVAVGEFGEAVSVPGILRGTVTVHADSTLWGADVNLRKSLFSTCDSRAEVFAGYRYLNLSEGLTITENITVTGPGGSRIAVTDPIGTTAFVQDRFITHNEFNGAQLGGLYQRTAGRWDVTARGSIGLGDTYQVLNIDGYQVRQQPGQAPMTYRGGLLAAGPNLGRFTQNRFSVVPELTLNVGYRVTPNVRVFAGYNFLFWSNVIRPGDQIDHTVDLTFVPNAPMTGFSGQYRPHPLFAQRDLAINGIQFGVDVRW